MALKFHTAEFAKSFLFIHLVSFSKDQLFPTPKNNVLNVNRNLAKIVLRPSIKKKKINTTDFVVNCPLCYSWICFETHSDAAVASGNGKPL